MNLTLLIQWFLFVYLNFCAGSVAFVVAWQDAAGRDRPVNFLTSWATIFMAAIVVSETALGMFGLLTVSALALVFGAAALVSWLAFFRFGGGLGLPAGWRASLRRFCEAFARGPLALTLVVVLVLSGTLAMTALLEPSSLWDTYVYHLPRPIDWLQHGFLTPAYVPLAEIAVSYFPGNAQLLYFWMLAPFRGDLLVRLVPVALWLLLGAGLWQVSRQVGATRTAAAVSVTLFLFTPVVLSESTELWSDVAQGALFVLALARLLEYARRPSSWTAALFGLACGLLLGIKYSSPAYLLLLLAAFGLVALSLRRSQSLPALLRSTVAIALTALAAGGFWYAYNLVLAGNPVFPVPVTVLGRTIFPGPGPSYGDTLWQMAPVIRPGDTIVALLTGYGCFFLLAAAIAAIGAAQGLRADRNPRDARWPLRHGSISVVGALFVGSLLLYMRTPYSVNRFDAVTPITPHALAAGMRFSVVAGACATVLVAAGLTRASRHAEGLAALAILGAITGCLAGSGAQDFGLFTARVFTYARIAVMGAVLVAGLLVLPSLSRIRWPRLPRSHFRANAYPAVAAVFLLVSVWLGLSGLAAYRERYRYQIYAATFGEVSRVWQWIEGNIDHAKIAYTGDNRLMGGSGRNFSNEVRYINVVGGLDQRYDDLDPPALGYRLEPTYEAWARNLVQWSAEYVVIAGAGMIEESWAAERPEAFAPIFDLGDYHIYRISQPLVSAQSVP